MIWFAIQRLPGAAGGEQTEGGKGGSSYLTSGHALSSQLDLPLRPCSIISRLCDQGKFTSFP